MTKRLISFDAEKPDLGIPDELQSRMDARYSGSSGGGGGGGGGLVPDPATPGLFVIQAASSLTPDPEHDGFFLIGA